MFWAPIMSEPHLAVSDAGPELRALRDGFERHVMPVLASLGFTRVDPSPSSRTPGRSVVAAQCTLPSGERVRVEVACYRAVAPRVQLVGPSGRSVELVCTKSDPSRARALSLSEAVASFETFADVRRGATHLTTRRQLALEFLGAEIVAVADQIVAAIPELGARVDEARQTNAWRDAEGRAHTLWQNRDSRPPLEDGPIQGRFTFVGKGLVVIVADDRRFTFAFDTTRIDPTVRPILTDWLTTPAGSREPGRLIVGDVSLSFDATGKLANS
jgi:hypothetical protein